MNKTLPDSDDFERTGFDIVENIVPQPELAPLAQEADRLLAESRSRGGARNALRESQLLREQAERGAVAALARTLLGSEARVTKLTLFNKTADANWSIRWHQDSAIAVKERREVPGFVGWSLKGGVVHVRPPVAVLESILALRLHLDDTPESNGALRVIPGSHRTGRLSREEISRKRSETPEAVCEVGRGGVMLMRPLLLHASSKVESPAKRRVLHFEYSAAGLPAGLEWA